jgi:ATPase subunit of ABC transporter with duplicated ATPase domains
LIISKAKKYGLIGENGIGKTTLLYSLARKEIEGMNKDP